MSYRIEKNEALSAALGRIAAEEIALAMFELRQTRHAETAMHNTRKALKRVRSLLYSLRVAFPKELFRRENRRLAVAGRKMAPVRDVHVQLRTLGKLRRVSGSASEKLEQRLRLRQDACARKIPALRQTVRRMLSDSREMLAQLPLEKATPAHLAASVKRIYKRGREAFREARKKTTPESLHEWRKQARILEHSFELIERLIPNLAATMIKQTGQLCEDLGDDHDLFLVLQVLGREDAARPATDYRLLSKRISARRARLEKHAFKLGKRIFSEKPSHFERHLALGLCQKSSKK